MTGGLDPRRKTLLARYFGTPGPTVAITRPSIAVAVHPLQTEANRFSRPADCPFDAVEPLANLADRVTLQAQLDDRAVVLIQAPEQPVHGLAQPGRLERRRLAAGDFQPGRPTLVPGRRRSFPRDVATSGA